VQVKNGLPGAEELRERIDEERRERMEEERRERMERSEGGA